MLWEALGISGPGVIACVGAGGKTSLVQSLAVSAGRRGVAALVTTTTRMFYSQVAGYALTLSDDYTAGSVKVAASLKQRITAAWLTGLEGEKACGLPGAWIDRLASSLPSAYILVEADGARRALLKAPAAHEPVVPTSTIITAGVLNLGVIGRALSPDNAHRLDLVTNIIHKRQGEIVSWLDIARLAVHPNGIFQHACGRKVLLLSGGGQADSGVVASQIAAYCLLAGTNIERVVVSAGYGGSMQPAAVYKL